MQTASTIFHLSTEYYYRISFPRANFEKNHNITFYNLINIISFMQIHNSNLCGVLLLSTPTLSSPSSFSSPFTYSELP